MPDQVAEVADTEIHRPKDKDGMVGKMEGRKQNMT